MIFSVLSFVAGILLFQQLSQLPNLEWLLLLLVLIVLSGIAKVWRFCFLLLGFSWAFWGASENLSRQLPDYLVGKDIMVTGEILGLPQQDGGRVRFDFLVNESKINLPEKLRLSWYYPKQKIQSGQIWQFTVRLKAPHGNFNPGGFDYERWLFVKGIGALGYIRDKPAPVLIAQIPIWRNISLWRQNIARHVDHLSGNSPFAGIIKAVTIGDRYSMTQKQWEVLRNTGTVHLMAISGLHIGLLAGMTYLLALGLWVKTGVQRCLPAKIAALAAIIIAVFYASLAGFSIPTQRALIMLCVAMGSILLTRHVRPFNTLALAMLILVIIDPLAVLAEGFWLSFIAVAVIIFTLGGRLKKRGYWQGALKIHFATALGLSPLLMLFFQQTSLIAPFANFIAVPVVGLLVVPLSLFTIVLSFISPILAQIVLQVIEFILNGLWYLLSYFSEFPSAVWYAPQPSIIAILLAMLGILILLAPRGIPGRSISLCLFLPLLFPSQKILQSGQVKMTLLDVGQGLSTVVQTENHVLVFDAGAKYSARFDSGENVILPFLRYNQVSDIDTLIVSHGDNDHIGGAGSLINGSDVKDIITSVPEKFSEFDPQVCVAGQTWQWDGVEFLILSPTEQSFSSENDNSCVLLITAANGKILLTGDIEAEAENWLVSTYGNQLQADVLIAPHHGSKTSSSEDFLRQVQAKYVLIPAGYRNRFGFPHQQVLKRYADFSIEPINVSEVGAITVNLGSGSLEIETWRNSHGRYWNH